MNKVFGARPHLDVENIIWWAISVTLIVLGTIGAIYGLIYVIVN